MLEDAMNQLINQQVQANVGQEDLRKMVHNVMLVRFSRENRGKGQVDPDSSVHMQEPVKLNFRI